jgi:Flp pilus assembly protein protease CpaA
VTAFPERTGTFQPKFTDGISLLAQIFVGNTIMSLAVESMNTSSLVSVFFFIFLGTCTVFDLARRQIPNSLSYAMITLLLLLNLGSIFVGENYARAIGGIGLADSILAGLICFGLLYALWFCHAIGGGDVKMGTALGMTLGVQNAMFLTFNALLLAGFAILFWQVIKFGPWSVILKALAHFGYWLGFTSAPTANPTTRRVVPLAPFTMASALLIFFYRV